jgi:hypothetical protein
MTSIEAQKIILDYHKSFKDLRPDCIVQSQSILPYVKGWIRYAHFVYGEELINQNKLSKDIAEILIESYSLIDEYFVEEPEPINEEYRKFISNLKSGLVIDFYMPNPFGNYIQALEYFNFLGERLFKLGKANILKDDKGEDVLLPVYVYKGLYQKALEEKDKNLCIEIVNTRLTRAVHFPGEKSDTESVFIKVK